MTREEDNPKRWTVDTQVLNLSDDRMRFRAQALTQLRANDREKLMSIQQYVKSIEFFIPMRFVIATPRQVMDGKANGWIGKSTLFVALLRLAGFPARVRLLHFSPGLLRGLVDSDEPFALPVVEIWTESRWIQTDTHIYDQEYLALARQALFREGWQQGFGVNWYGTMTWNGHDTALVMAATLREGGPSVVADLGVYHDPHEFLPVLQRKDGGWLTGKSRFRVRALQLRAGIKRLREEGRRI